jgi:chemotaxis protein methyltransferase CheR
VTGAPALAGAGALVAARLGLDFPQRRRADLERGVAEAARAAGFRDRGAYLAQLGSLGVESAAWQRLVTRLTVGESYFFRDRAVHALLAREVLPELIAERRARSDRTLRIWSAGCARGEEPYSLAILLDRLLPDRADWTLTIQGTDVDDRSLEAARRGIYAAWSLRDTPPADRALHFRPRSGRRFELDPAIREMAEFARLNLVDEAYPAGMDLILCRNVVMYFTEDARRAVIGRLERSLVPGGWLVLGAAEATAESLRLVTPVAFPDAVIHRRAQPPAPEPAATPPQPGPLQPAALVRQAGAYADEGRLDEAIGLFDEALRHDRLNPELHVLVAAIHHERGELDRALAACRSAVSLNPDSAAAHFLLGNLLVQRGAAAHARRAMEAVAGLLRSVPRDEPVGGLTAGRMLEAAEAYLEPAR